MADPATLRVLVPEATTNYILNPAFRYDELGWTSTDVATSRTRTLDQARFNIASLKIITAGSALHEGVFYRVSSLSGVSEPITCSVYVRGNVGNEVVRLRFRDNAAGQEVSAEPVTLRKDRWIRLEVTGQSYGGNDLRLYVESADQTAKLITFYVDGAQMERKAYATSYCDGDQPGCQWNIVSHGSVSTRLADTREGGRWVRIAGPCPPDGNDDIYVTVISGFGMPPISNSIQSWALSPGSFYQSTKINDRVVILNFNVKNEQLDPDVLPDISPLHLLRQKLIDVLKPDLTAGGQPFLFEYKAGDHAVYEWLRYEAGLDGSWDIRNAVLNQFPVRLLAVSPLIFEDNQNVKQLDFSDTLPDLGAAGTDLYRKKQGVWTNLSLTSPMPIDVQIVEGPNRELYFFGWPTPNNAPVIVKWDGSTFTTLAHSTVAAHINSIAVAPNGDIYAVGNFTTISGVAANRIAKRDATTGVWSALSTGLNGEAFTVCIADNGWVYVGGSFTTAGGGTVNRIAYWDGLAWRVVGTPAGLDNTVYSIVKAKDGHTLYLGGNFTAASSGTPIYQSVVSVDTNTNLFTNIGSVVSSVIDLIYGMDFKLYAVSQLYVSVYNGRQWSQLGGTCDAIIRRGCMGPDGSIFICGAFTKIGLLPIDKIGKWSNNVWNGLDLEIADADSPVALKVQSNNELFMALQQTAAIFVNGLTTIHNEGTSEVSPILYIKGPGFFRYLENLSNKKKCYFNLNLLPGEEVFIDFGRGTIKSTTRGDLLWTLLSPSDFKAFVLEPEDNIIEAFMQDDVGGLMQMSYIPSHWSGDATITPEPL